MLEVQDKPELQSEEVKTVDLQTTKEPTKKRTVLPKKINEDHSNNSKNDSKSDSKTEEKVIRIGINNLMKVAKFKEEDKGSIRKQLEQLKNLNSDEAPMYDLDGVVELFMLDGNQAKRLRTLATTRAKRLTPQEIVSKSVDYDSKVKALESNLKSIERLKKENDSLKAEIKTLKRELKL